jgi:hypothetical protein
MTDTFNRITTTSNTKFTNGNGTTYNWTDDVDGLADILWDIMSAIKGLGGTIKRIK